MLGGSWVCRAGIGLLILACDTCHGVSVSEGIELTVVLATFLGPEVRGPCMSLCCWMEDLVGNWWIEGVAGKGRVHPKQLSCPIPHS